MLKWVFGADTGPYRSALQQLRKETSAFAGNVKGELAGLFGVGAIIAWGMATLDAAGRIDDLSKRLNISAESFQRLSYASKLSGGDMELVGKALTFLSKNLADAKDDAAKFEGAAETLGIDLKKLTEMSAEQQMVELARGYSQTADKGAALNAIMKLLGKSGAEVIPMLAEGPEALQELFEEATVATDAQIAAMAKLGDEMDKLKSKSVAALGSMIDGFKIWGAYAEYALNKVFGTSTADQVLDMRMDKIMYGERKKTPDTAAMEEAARKNAEAEKERVKLAEEIGKLEEDAKMRQLSLSEKILALEKKRAELNADSLFNEDENKRLEARKEALETERQIADLRKQQAQEQQAATQRQSEARDKYKEAIQAEKKAAFESSLSGMSDQDKIGALKTERSRLLNEAKALFEDGSDTTMAEGVKKRTEAAGVQSRIDDITRSMNEKLQTRVDELGKASPTIATSSLAEIGGGGGVNTLLSQEAILKESRNLLAEIAANTRNAGGSSNLPDPI